MAVFLVAGAFAAAPALDASAARATSARAIPALATAQWRPSRADWQKIRLAAQLRKMALAPHRTAHYRAFAAYLGLNELVSLHRLHPGRCALAVRYLYNNLLDLSNAYPGENWVPLRRLVAREPRITACRPGTLGT